MKRIALILAVCVVSSPLPVRASGTLLSTTGSVGADTDHDGFLDVGPSKLCNPAGYVQFHPMYWWRNTRWVFNSAYGAPIQMGHGVNSGSGGGSGYPWLDFRWDSSNPFGIDEGPESGSGFGTDEGPPDGGFGIGEGPVPEPSSAVLLMLGATAMIRRRALPRAKARMT